MALPRAFSDNPYIFHYGTPAVPCPCFCRRRRFAAACQICRIVRRRFGTCFIWKEWRHPCPNGKHHKDYELCHCLRIRFKGNDLHHKRLCRFHARCPVKCKERRNVYLKWSALFADVKIPQWFGSYYCRKYCLLLYLSGSVRHLSRYVWRTFRKRPLLCVISFRIWHFFSAKYHNRTKQNPRFRVYGADEWKSRISWLYTDSFYYAKRTGCLWWNRGTCHNGKRTCRYHVLLHTEWRVPGDYPDKGTSVWFL